MSSSYQRTNSTRCQYAPFGSGFSSNTFDIRIWLFDVRDSLPTSARLEGFDISFDAAPPIETLPHNVTFRHWNVTEDLPEDLEGVFDIVHVRFFAFVLLNDQVEAVVGRLFKLLSKFHIPSLI